MGQTEVNEYSPIVKQFNDDYFAAMKPEVQALLKRPMAGRPIEALKLAQAGVLIDTSIVLGLGMSVRTYGGAADPVLWGEEPWLVHLMRTNFGVPYVGSLEGLGPRGGLDPERPMAVPVAQWVVPPSKIPTVYFDPDDIAGTMTRLHVLYPPPPPPPPTVVQPTSTSLFGAYVGSGIWMGGPGANRETVRPGQEGISPSLKAVIAHVEGGGLMNPTGVTIYWTLK